MRNWPLGEGNGERNAHAISRETLAAEVLDWWEREQERISQELQQKLFVIRSLLGDFIQSSSRLILLSGEKFVQEEVEPLVGELIEWTYRDVFEQMEKSFLASVAEIEARKAAIDIEDWSYGNMAKKRIAHGVVPPAPLLKDKSANLAGAGILVLTLVAPPIALLGATGVAGVGLIHMLQVKQKWKDHLDPMVKLALFGDNARPEVQSLRGILLGELRTAAQSRMEAITQ